MVSRTGKRQKGKEQVLGVQKKGAHNFFNKSDFVLNLRPAVTNTIFSQEKQNEDRVDLPVIRLSFLTILPVYGRLVY